jgi:DNA processing protein
MASTSTPDINPWLQLSLTDGLGPVLIQRLVQFAGNAEKALHLSPKELRNVEGFGDSRISDFQARVNHAKTSAEKQTQYAQQFNAKILTPDSDEYPPLLKDIHDPPPVLFCQGNIEPRDLFSVAIVGSRRCTLYGREQAQRFASLLAGAGVTVVSGGARGIDSASHKGALQQPNGRTLAVVGTGLDIPYPSENADLYVQIAKRGAVISEYPFGTPPTPENFPRRNRIISGISRGVLVVEADERSGALITARLAAEEQARTVFALPGRVDNPLSSGPHSLIKDGAVLVQKLDDILHELPPLPDQVAAPQEPALEFPAVPSNLTENQRRIMLILTQEPLSVEQIMEQTQLSAGVVLKELTFLTLKSQIRRGTGQSFRLNPEK